jgi:hypothetical protein
MRIRHLLTAAVVGVFIAASSQAFVIDFSFASATGQPVEFSYDGAADQLSAADVIDFEVSIDGNPVSYDAANLVFTADETSPGVIDSVQFTISNGNGTLLSGSFANGGLMTMPAMGVGWAYAGNDGQAATMAYTVTGDLATDIDTILAPGPLQVVVYDSNRDDMSISLSNLRALGDDWTAFGSFTGNTNVEVREIPEPASLALFGLGGLLMIRRPRRS